MPWVGAVIEAALILMGLWMVAGRLGDPKTMSVRGFFLFGLAYGLASLSCTLPVFLVVMGGSLTADGFVARTGRFLSYGLGMASVLLILTLAFFKGGVGSRPCKATP